MGRCIISLSLFDFLWVVPKTIHEEYSGSCGTSHESSRLRVFRTWELLSIPLAPASYPVLCEFRSIPEDNRERQKSFHESSGRRLSQSLLLAPVPVISSALNLKRKKNLAVRKRQKSVSSLNYTNWFESGKLVSSSEVGIAEKSGLRARKGL